MAWTDIGAVADLPEGSATEAVVSGRLVAVYRSEGRFYGLDGVCSHQGGPLSEGSVEGGVVTCPWHGWQYRLTDGANTVIPSVRQACFPVRIDADRILVSGQPCGDAGDSGGSDGGSQA